MRIAAWWVPTLLAGCAPSTAGDLGSQAEPVGSEDAAVGSEIVSPVPPETVVCTGTFQVTRDGSADGLSDGTIRIVSDADGRPLSEEWALADGTGSRETWIYAGGRPVSMRFTSNSPGRSPVTATWAYADGVITATTTVSEVWSLDPAAVYTARWDEAGHPVYLGIEEAHVPLRETTFAWDGDQLVSYGYDYHDGATGVGSWTYTPDAEGRVASIVRRDAFHAHDYLYRWDGDELAGATYVDEAYEYGGTVRPETRTDVTYTRDEQGRVVRADEDADGDGVPEDHWEYRTDDGGHVIEALHFDSHHEDPNEDVRFEYADGRLVRRDDGVSRTWSWTAEGQVATYDDGPVHEAFAWDGDRLVDYQETQDGSHLPVHRAYDERGNVVTSERSGEVTSYQWSDACECADGVTPPDDIWPAAASFGPGPTSPCGRGGPVARWKVFPDEAVDWLLPPRPEPEEAGNGWWAHAGAE